MPAEAHQQREPVTPTEITDLVARFVGLDVVAPNLPLSDVASTATLRGSGCDISRPRSTPSAPSPNRTTRTCWTP